MTHDLWENLNTTVVNYLAGVTLAQLASKQRTEAKPGTTRLLQMPSHKASRSRKPTITPAIVV